MVSSITYENSPPLPETNVCPPLYHFIFFLSMTFDGGRTWYTSSLSADFFFSGTFIIRNRSTIFKHGNIEHRLFTISTICIRIIKFSFLQTYSVGLHYSKKSPRGTLILTMFLINFGYLNGPIKNFC